MKQQGELVELKFYLKMYEQGFIISKPFGDNAPYDFIVDSNSNFGLNRVQVKSTSRLDTAKRQNRYFLSVAHGADTKKPYTKAEIDVLVGYVIPENTWYIIPIEQCNQRNIALYPHREGVGKFERYKEWWAYFQSCPPSHLQRGPKSDVQLTHA